MRNIAILSAVGLEIRAVASAMGIAAPAPAKSTDGVVAGLPVSLHLIGFRARNLATAQLDKEAVVILAGLAGALDPVLKIGDLVVNADPPELLSATEFRSGLIHTSTELVDSPQRKAELFRSTGACAVDMESEIVRNWARQQGARFIAIRAISDTAEEMLHRDLINLVDDWGRVRPSKLAGLLLRKPRQISGLLRVGRNAKFAARQLGIAVKDIVNQIANSTGPASSADCAPPWSGQ